MTFDGAILIISVLMIMASLAFSLSLLALVNALFFMFRTKQTLERLKCGEIRRLERDSDGRPYRERL